MSDPTLIPMCTEGAPFGNYRLLRQIGSGGMGAVYLAEHMVLKKQVALKVLHPAIAASPEVRARFLREGEACARIRHPHIVDIADVGVHGNVPYLVMEHLEGEDLGAILQREGRLSVGRTAELLLPICAGVSAAHRAGVVHRDLKPENIFIARDVHGEPLPKVLDFGVSKFQGDTSEQVLTAAASLLGTPEYMAPEQVRGAHDIDARADQYALGVILYHCVTGRMPVQGGSLYDLLERVVQGDYAAPRTLRESLPDPFEGMVLRAMQPDPEGRYTSVDALGRALLTFASARTRARWEHTFSENEANGAPKIHSNARAAVPGGCGTVAFDPPPEPRMPADVHRAADDRAGDAVTLDAPENIAAGQAPTLESSESPVPPIDRTIEMPAPVPAPQRMSWALGAVAVALAITAIALPQMSARANDARHASAPSHAAADTRASVASALPEQPTAEARTEASEWAGPDRTRVPSTVLAPEARAITADTPTIATPRRVTQTPARPSATPSIVHGTRPAGAPARRPVVRRPPSNRAPILY